MWPKLLNIDSNESITPNDLCGEHMTDIVFQVKIL